jgi:hypothetical protein
LRSSLPTSVVLSYDPWTPENNDALGEEIGSYSAIGASDRLLRHSPSAILTAKEKLHENGNSVFDE